MRAMVVESASHTGSREKTELSQDRNGVRGKQAGARDVRQFDRSIPWKTGRSTQSTIPERPPKIRDISADFPKAEGRMNEFGAILTLLIRLDEKPFIQSPMTIVIE
jgi:hypothetical protein